MCTPCSAHLKQDPEFNCAKCHREESQVKQAFSAIWDSVTDLLPPESIDRLESIHKTDFELLE